MVLHAFRVRYEEATLLRFYPNEYPAYRERTSIGIPFIDTTKDAARGKKQSDQ